MPFPVCRKGRGERNGKRESFVKSFVKGLVIMNKLKTKGLCDLHEFTK